MAVPSQALDVEEEEEEAVFISVVNTNEDPPRLAGKGGQGTGRTAYGIRDYIRSMKRTKRRIQLTVSM